MMFSPRWVLAAAFLAFGLAAVTAHRAAGQYANPLSIRGGIGLTTTSYREAATIQSNTVARSFGFQSLIEPRLYETIGVPVNLGWEYLGPICLDAGGSAGCPSRSKRKTSLLFASFGIALYGPSIPPASGESAARRRPFVVAGREWVSRGIGDGDCLNCTIESVRFHGGLFVEPGIELPAGDDLIIGLGYRVYGGSADLENRIVLRLTSWDRRRRGR